MSLEIQISSSLLLTSANKRQTCFTSGVLFGVIFFPEIMLESWGCGLYTSAAYTRVFMVIGISRGVEGLRKTPFRGGGMDIFCGYTFHLHNILLVAYILVEKGFCLKIDSNLGLKTSTCFPDINIGIKKQKTFQNDKAPEKDGLTIESLM